MIKEELEQKKEKIWQLQLEGRLLLTKREQLIQSSEEVRKYREIEHSLQEKNKQLEKLLQELDDPSKEECQHPVWYYLDGSIDPYQEQMYYTCQCVACGLIRENKKSQEYPKHRIVWDPEYHFLERKKSAYSYEEVVQAYNIVMKAVPEEERDKKRTSKAFVKMMNYRKKRD